MYLIRFRGHERSEPPSIVPEMIVNFDGTLLKEEEALVISGSNYLSYKGYSYLLKWFVKLEEREV